MDTLHAMLARMYSLSIWDNQGQQYLPLFDYQWRDVTTYVRADDAIRTNTQLWILDHPDQF